MSTTLQTKVSFALDENRTLMLGSQVLLGFGYQIFFEKGFNDLTQVGHNLRVANLFLILASAVLLIAPTCCHRILGADAKTERLLSFTTGIIEWALHPLAVALGLSIFCSIQTLAGFYPALVGGCAITALALSGWFIGPILTRYLRLKRKVPIMKYSTPVETRLRHVLTESRVMLPGAQALLGFQLITFYTEEYQKLERGLQWIHLFGLLLIALSVILLIAPAAFHRVADRGEATERIYQFASTMVLVSSVPLGLGLVSEFYLVMVKIGAGGIALLGSGFILVCCICLWFGYALFIRQKSN